MHLIRRLVLVFSFLFVLLPIKLNAEPPNDTDVQAVPVPTPRLDRVEQPTGTYRVGEMLSYRIHILWPELPENVRMDSPEIQTENLQLEGVRQETNSTAENVLGKGIEQILTFQFLAQKTGKAEISRFSLRWNQGDGAVSSQIEVPAVRITIAPASKPWPVILGLGTGLLGLLFGSITLILNRKNRKRAQVPNPTVLSLEDQFIEDANRLYHTHELKPNPKDFLEGLTRLLLTYVKQKLDWNPSQGGYNTLEKKAGERWSQKEAARLRELLQALEYERFSGTQTSADNVKATYEKTLSFINQRRVI
ncbi:MAG: hypothetical protein HY588_02810 [Candidatus Omnitrophica bacterium]|nr:hypothetical protein [Candidatus Omnitrophota bacterium]